MSSKLDISQSAGLNSNSWLALSILATAARVKYCVFRLARGPVFVNDAWGLYLPFLHFLLYLCCGKDKSGRPVVRYNIGVWEKDVHRKAHHVERNGDKIDA